VCFGIQTAQTTQTTLFGLTPSHRKPIMSTAQISPDPTSWYTVILMMVAPMGLLGIITGMITWLGYLARNYLTKKFVATVVISQHEPHYPWMRLWLGKEARLEENGGRVSLASVPQSELDGRRGGQLDTHKPPEMHMQCAKGERYTIINKGRRLWIQLTEVKDEGENLEISLLNLTGDAYEFVKELVMEARDLYLERMKKRTRIMITSGNEFGSMAGGWDNLGSRPSRPISTVIIEDGIAEKLLSDVQEFIGSAEWYAERGQPYRRGYLLHGPPGCGKSSLINAIAGELHMAICICDLSSKSLTNAKLMTLISSVPKHSILLLEDVDAAFRTDPAANDDDSDSGNSASMPARGSKEASGITFSGLLNALDGIAGQEGSVVFMTTNHIDRLDDALIRPGRVDVRMQLKLATQAVARRLFQRFYSNGTPDTPPELATLAQQFASKIPDQSLCPAAIQGHLMSYKGDPDGALRDMQVLLGSEEAHPAMMSRTYSSSASKVLELSHCAELPSEQGAELSHIAHGLRQRSAAPTA